MRDATEEEKKAFTENLRNVMGFPDTYDIEINKLWTNHQIPEDMEEWYRNLCTTRSSLELAQSDVEFLKKEVDAQTYIGLAMFYSEVPEE